MRRLDLQTGERMVIEAGSDQLHQHAAPIRVELDGAALAEAFVKASRMARQERQAVEPARSPIVVPNASHRLPEDRPPSRRVLDLDE